jgi:hypothetical protein
MKTQFDLTKEAVLVDLTVGARGLSARSRKLSEEAAEKHQADRRSVGGVVQKFLSSDLKGITKALNNARTVVKDNTLEWGSGGFRLLPLGRRDSLYSGIAAVEVQLEEAVQDLIDNYDRISSEYKRRVNDLSDEVPFPTREALASNFRITLDELPLADPGTVFLNHMSTPKLEEFRNRINEEMTEKLWAANEDLVYRMIEQVQKLKNQVGKDPKETKFHKSLITNLEKTIDVVDSLNLTNDPKIDKLIARIKRDLASVDINDLKNDGQVRKAVESDADSILKDLQAL